MGKENKILYGIYLDKEITSCELRFDGCWVNNALSFAHYKKRRFYLSRPELLSSFYQTILCCINCHNAIEYDRALTERTFRRLRGERTFEEWNEPKSTTLKSQTD